jgi:hypothetical protein
MTIKQLKRKNKKLSQQLFQSRGRTAIANRTVYEQMQHIEMLNRELDDVKKNNWNTLSAKFGDMIDSLKKTNDVLNKQLKQQDNAIIRKDMQFEGLKSCYKDDLINGRLG